MEKGGAGRIATGAKPPPVGPFSFPPTPRIPTLSPPPSLPSPPVPGNGVDNSDTLKALSSAVAAATGKPESYVLVSLRTDAPLLFGGTEAPAAYGELLSIGAIGGAKNKAISKAIADVVSAKLGVDANRFYLSFHDSAASDFGWNGSTFG